MSETIKSIDVDSVYVLIDRVDETELTGNDSKASFRLIEPLIKDLELLEMKDIGYKFFLWNELEPYYIRSARPDRIPQFELNWTSEELEKIIQLRLQAFSSKEKVIKFDDLFSSTIKKEAVKDLVKIFSHGSPRDMIRICRQMVVEQLRLNSNSNSIDSDAITNGLNTFCIQRTKEVISKDILEELQKVHRLDFTVNYVASNVFKISKNAARSKISIWLNTGFLKHIDDIQVSSFGRPVHHYAIMDSRIAKSIFLDLNFTDFLDKKVKRCPKCKQIMLRDWDLSSKHICQYCKTTFS